ncbi:MAG: hypothetical protein VYE73_18335 [Acidobacteriota bacterium]|nr:hypothetical protein [Acidobacteriota bacterium]
MTYRSVLSWLVLGVLAFAVAAPACAATAPDEDLQEGVAYLSSPQLGGRLTGTQGERLAAEFLVERLEKLGAVPLEGQPSLLVPFEFTAGVSDSGSRVSVGDETWSTDRVRALSFSDEGSVEGEVVFAGYGLKVPETRDFSYDSYFGLDVRDKIVVVLRYYPQDAEDDTRTLLARYAGLRYKALQARELGATGVLLVTVRARSAPASW